jgi:hypothetical protein
MLLLIIERGIDVYMNEEKDKSRISVVLMITGILLLIGLTVGLTYAYFSANITGSETSTTITTSSGTITIVYGNGTTINAANIAPGWSAVKTFTVTGSNTTAAYGTNLVYAINLVKQTNTFSTGALTYSLSGTGSGGTLASASSASITTGAGTQALGTGNFVNASSTYSNVAHSYTLTVAFPNTPEAAQNGEQGKSFTGYITITSDTKITQPA